jgi:hypothetical protein
LGRLARLHRHQQHEQVSISAQIPLPAATYMHGFRHVMRYLSYCAPHVTDLTISLSCNPTLQQLLELCPNVRHLCLRAREIDEAPLDYVRVSVGKSLKSFEIHFGHIGVGSSIILSGVKHSSTKFYL